MPVVYVPPLPVEPRPLPMATGSYNGIGWNHPTDKLTVKDFEGIEETPSVTTQDRKRALEPGSWTGDDSLDSRSPGITFVVLADDNDELRTLLAQIELAWRVDSTDRTLWLYDSSRYLTARVRRRHFEHYNRGEGASALVVVQWFAADPQYHGAATTLILPRGVSTEVANPGVETPLIWRVTGPSTNPGLVNEASLETLGFTYSVPSGQVLEANTEFRTVTLNGAPITTPPIVGGGRWWDLLKGVQDVRFDSASGGSSSLVYAPRWD